jgi:hypothetical protein
VLSPLSGTVVVLGDTVCEGMFKVVLGTTPVDVESSLPGRSPARSRI